MKIVVENKVPFIQGLPEAYFDEVVYAPAAEITPRLVKDAAALVTRTRTQCDRHLLDGSKVEMIATATIGTDHIDLDYCNAKGIAVANAPGCNAPAVAQWVLASIAKWLKTKPSLGGRVEKLRLGVVGVGHVGSIVARWAAQAGFDVMMCDPPRRDSEGGDRWKSIDEIASACDIITFHTPLTASGKYPTFHLIDDRLLSLVSRETPRLVMNAARGSIADTDAMLAASDNIDFAIDCWEEEPALNIRLLERAFVATPHIAGYSIEGKIRGTAMAIEAINRHFGYDCDVPKTDKPLTGATTITLQDVENSYDPLVDTAALKSVPSAFERLRNNYNLRHEL